ncbi:CLUMA_CG000893, isoform A [Clunio marinus]|uniref:CLUMA_CG000893, isoform A n=1 Tax=Clunio marinus TaxID=568069 RepID=A0A1J1HGB0_9DIPT|nr:CLUMA_CG000893, isoform A [Clunio marinus]
MNKRFKCVFNERTGNCSRTSKIFLQLLIAKKTDKSDKDVVVALETFLTEIILDVLNMKLSACVNCNETEEDMRVIVKELHSTLRYPY